MEPWYLMIVDGKRHWLPIKEAGRAFDCGWIPVEIGGVVIEGGAERSITSEERARIVDIAEEWSASK